MSDHTCCLGIHMCRDKTSCPRQQLNGGFIESARDMNLIGLHLARSHGRAQCAVYNEESRTIGPSVSWMR